MNPLIAELARKLSNHPERIAPAAETGVHAMTDKGRAHLESLTREKAVLPWRPPQRQLRQEVTYAEAWRVFARYMRQREYEISAIQNKPFEWDFSDEMKKRIADIIRYFINDPASAYPLNRGLLIYGKPGTGKTEVMQAVQFMCKSLSIGKQFEWTDMSEEYTAARADKDYDPVKVNVQSDRCFDEFLRQSGVVNPRGIDLNEIFIEQRYKRFKNYGQITHIISNLDSVDIRPLMSTMAFDRMREMCRSVQFTGESKRT